MLPGILLPVADLLTLERITVPSSASNKDAVLAELVALAVPEGPERDGLLAEVRKREARFTTALGDGIALPHARSEFVSALHLSATRLASPVPFDAVDGTPVELAFLVVSPSNAPGAHLESLRALSQLFQNPRVIADLKLAATPEEFLRTLRLAEAS